MSLVGCFDILLCDHDVVFFLILVVAGLSWRWQKEYTCNDIRNKDD